MASLNTLRTKFGVVLSIVIGIALLAFVLSLKTEMGFSGQDPKVGVIAGDNIKYSDYLEAYDRVKTQRGDAAENDPQQADMLANTAWQQLIADYVLTPGFEKLGVSVGEVERMGMISGEHPSQALFQAFGDPRTGTYDVAMVTEFLTQAETNVQARQMWTYLNENMKIERSMGKYLALLKGGVYVNKLEIENGVKGANNTYSGRWAGMRYDQVPDSLFTVSSSEVKNYYKSHKNMFRQLPSRTVSYVVFDVNATDADMLALSETVSKIGEEFAAADVKAYVRANRNGRIADRYVPASQLAEDEAAALMAGRQYGPILKNNEWTMARVIDEKIAPDTLGIRHIVLPYSEEKLADSLLVALRGGADFAQTARTYSVYDATAAQGGEVGVMPFSAFTGEFVDGLTNVKQGDIVKIASGDVIQLMQVYKAGKPTRHVQIASITYPVEASAETRRLIHNNAGTFSVNAKGSTDKFNEAVAIAAATPRVASIPQGERQINGLDDSREIVRWVYEAKEGDVSEIFTVGPDYVIAVLTNIDDEKFTPLNRASEQVEAEIRKEKKYDHIVNNIQGTSFDEIAQGMGGSRAFEGIGYPAYYIQGLGVEPRVVGAIASASQTGVVSDPVKGKTGAYIFQLENITTEQTQTPDAEKVRAQAAAENMIQQRSLQAVQQMANIEDLRGEYF